MCVEALCGRDKKMVSNTAGIIFCLIASLQVGGTKWASGKDLDIYEGNNEFALDLYNEIAKNNIGKNLFFSPISITYALAMTSLGTDGETKKELMNVLKIHKNPSSMHESLIKLNEKLNANDVDYQLSIANKIYADKSTSLRKTFSSAVFSNYGVEPEQLDFSNQINKARKTINEWISKQTNDKIKDLADSLDGGTKIALVNAIYFKGNWLNKFDKERTENEYFQIEESEEVQVPMMYTSKMIKVNRASLPKKIGHVFECPYFGNKISMFIVMPTSSVRLADVEKSLTADVIKSLTFKESSAYFSMPKFSLEKQEDLVNILQKLGLNDLFSEENADLTQMSLSNNLYISNVLHKAYIDVNEEGSEAAGATVVEAVGRSYVAFTIDRSFIFYIQDKETGTILFMGKVVDPRVKA